MFRDKREEMIRGGRTEMQKDPSMAWNQRLPSLERWV